MGSHKQIFMNFSHQTSCIIKGTFKDHLVDWVAEYLHITHGETVALEIIEDIDHRCVCFMDNPYMLC